MAKQNKVAKLLKTLAVSSLCIGMIFPASIVKAAEQNVTPSGTQEQEMQYIRNVSIDIETKVKAKGGITKITKSEIKQILNEEDIDSSSKNELLNHFNSMKDFNKDIKSKGGFKNLSLIEIRNSLNKFFTNPKEQENLFYSIRNQMMNSKAGGNMIWDILNYLDQQNKIKHWKLGNDKLWRFCDNNGSCASGFLKLRSSHHYVNGHRDNGYRWYYFHEGNKALRYTSGWWTFHSHTYYNDGIYGMYTNETFVINSHNYHFDNNGYSHRLW